MILDICCLSIENVQLPSSDVFHSPATTIQRSAMEDTYNKFHGCYSTSVKMLGLQETKIVKQDYHTN